MIQLSNTTAQTIVPGGSVTFDIVMLHTGCGECFNRQIPKSVKLCGKGIYELHFSANITASAAATSLQLAMAVGGQPLVETVMNATPAAAGDLVNVSRSTLFDNCCCDMDRISIVNTGTAPVTIAPNSNFYVKRVS